MGTSAIYVAMAKRDAQPGNRDDGETAYGALSL